MILQALLELDVLIPERVCKEVLTAAFCATLKKSRCARSVSPDRSEVWKLG
jgi:hypothetical protein